MANQLTPVGYKLNADRLRQYVQNADAANTRNAYQADLLHFTQWGGNLPASPQVVAAYLSAHAESLALATLKRRVVAISRAHAALNYPNPTQHELVRLTLRGIARTHGQPQRQVRPLLREDVLAIHASLGSSLRDLRDKALLLTGFCGGFRRSELVALRVCDMALVREGLVITLPRSKTDQTGQGRKIGIPYGRGLVCPVKALLAWQEAAGITEGLLFRQVLKGSKVGGPLSAHAVAVIIKQHATAVGLPAAEFSGHSLRAGLATSAAQAGYATHKIRAQTGHRSDAMLARYIRDGDLFTNNAGGLF